MLPQDKFVQVWLPAVRQTRGRFIQWQVWRLHSLNIPSLEINKLFLWKKLVAAKTFLAIWSSPLQRRYWLPSAWRKNAFHRETQFHGETHLFMDLCYRRTEQWYSPAWHWSLWQQAQCFLLPYRRQYNFRRPISADHWNIPSGQQPRDRLRHDAPKCAGPLLCCAQPVGLRWDFLTRK